MKKIIRVGLCLLVGFSAFATESILAERAVVDTKIISSIKQTEKMLSDTRDQFLPVVPPNGLRYIHSFKDAFPVEWSADGWPEAMRRQMFAELGSIGTGKTMMPFYRLFVVTDYWTGESVYFNSYGTEVLRRPAKTFPYDPYA